MVSVRFLLADAFQNNNTVQALQSGLPTSFTYVIEIYRARSKWFDEGIDRSRIEVIASFNSVTREYLLNYRRDRKLVRSETLSDLETLQKFINLWFSLSLDLQVRSRMRAMPVSPTNM